MREREVDKMRLLEKSRRMVGRVLTGSREEIPETGQELLAGTILAWYLEIIP